MIIFIRIVLIYFIIGCVFGLLVNWLITTIYAETANWLNRKIKDEVYKKILLVMVFLWPICLVAAVHSVIKEKQKTCSDKIIEMILNDDFYEEES